MSKTEKYNFCVRMFRANWYVANFQINTDDNTIKMLSINRAAPSNDLKEHLFVDVLCKRILYFCDYEKPSFARRKMATEEQLKKLDKTHVLISYNLNRDKLTIMHVGTLDSCADWFENILFLLSELDDVYGVGEEQGWKDLCAGKTYHHQDGRSEFDLMLLMQLP